MVGGVFYRWNLPLFYGYVDNFFFFEKVSTLVQVQSLYLINNNVKECIER